MYTISVGNVAVEVVDEYLYLGHVVQLGKLNFEKAISNSAVEH